MSRRTDDAPAFLPLDTSTQLGVDAVMRVMLNTYVEIAAEDVDDEGAEGSLPTFSVEKLGGFLRSVCVAPEHAHPLTASLISAMITQKTLSLLKAQIELDLAMEALLKGRGVVSLHNLFINDPIVTEALESYELPEGEVIFVPAADFFPCEQLTNDPRRDMLMGAIRWNGIYLCRPSLVSLPDIEDALAEADVYGAIHKVANVSYLPRFGTH